MLCSALLCPLLPLLPLIFFLFCCAVLCCAVLCSLCLSSPGSVSGRLDYHRHNARQDRGHGGCAAQNWPCSFCFRVACPEPVLANHRFSNENTRETNATFILSNSGPLCVLLPFLVFRHHQSVLCSGNLISSDFGDSLGYTDEPPSLRSTLRSALLSALLSAVCSAVTLCSAVLCCALWWCALTCCC
eukprot:COSAG05_NODE_4988_length_1301_cov_0.989185_1_plen_187_part_00